MVHKFPQTKVLSTSKCTNLTRVVPRVPSCLNWQVQFCKPYPCPCCGHYSIHVSTTHPRHKLPMIKLIHAYSWSPILVILVKKTTRNHSTVFCPALSRLVYPVKVIRLPTQGTGFGDYFDRVPVDPYPEVLCEKKAIERKNRSCELWCAIIVIYSVTAT